MLRLHKIPTGANSVRFSELRRGDLFTYMDANEAQVFMKVEQESTKYKMVRLSDGCLLYCANDEKVLKAEGQMQWKIVP